MGGAGVMKRLAVLTLVLGMSLLLGCSSANTSAAQKRRKSETAVQAATSTTGNGAPAGTPGQASGATTGTPAAGATADNGGQSDLVRDKVKHVIIIMQENRSFDEYFGTYPGADGIPMQA